MSGHTLIFGVLVPAAVFLFSFWMTELLYRHFAREDMEGESPEDPLEGTQD